MKIGSPVPHKKARIEIIPLIDIMFFLLASFMMVSLSMIKLQSIKVDLPTATRAGRELKPDMFNLAVDRVGDIFIEEERKTLAQAFDFSRTSSTRTRTSPCTSLATGLPPTVR